MNSAFGNDLGDAAGVKISNNGNRGPVAKMVTPRLASEYNMNHKKRGFALIFNNETFETPKLKSRTGTNVDCDNLKKTLRDLAFDIRVCNNYSFSEIDKCTTEIAEWNHSDFDCLLVAILSHGEYGYIYARDTQYKLETIWKKFTGDLCPSLAGKPKLFFIQACQGEGLDGGVTLVHPIQTDSDSMGSEYKIPTHADFLIAYSTIPGFYSWRNTTRGSWFMQALCQELDQHGTDYDILTLLTFVIQKVALDFESNTPDYIEMHQQKQIPCVTTMLTRLLRFNKKY